jgi:hypothetical protein
MHRINFSSVNGYLKETGKNTSMSTNFAKRLTSSRDIALSNSEFDSEAKYFNDKSMKPDQPEYLEKINKRKIENKERSFHVVMSRARF